MLSIPPALREPLASARHGRDLMHRCKMDTPGYARGERLWEDARLLAVETLRALEALRREERAGLLGGR